MDSCQQIVIEVENNEVIFNPIVCGVGGIIGAIVGIVFGFLILKYFCLKIVKNKFAPTPTKITQDSLEFQHEYDKSESHNSKNKERSERAIDYNEIDQKSDSGNASKVNLETNTEMLDKGFIEILFANSFDAMLKERQSVAAAEIERISLNSWNDRHHCMIEIFKLILDNYLENERIDKTEHQRVLRNANENLSKLSMELDFNRTSKENNVNEEINSETLQFLPKEMGSNSKVHDFNEVISGFESDLLELVGFKDAAIVREVLVKSVKNIEENVGSVQEQSFKMTMDSFCRDLLVMQAYFGGRLAQEAISKKRRHHYKTMISRLAESERLSEDDSDHLWRNIKEKVEKKYKDLTEDFEKSARKLATQCKRRRTKAKSDLMLTKEQSLERYFTDNYRSSPTHLVNEYFNLMSDLRLREFSTLQELTKNEVFQINELQKETKLKLLSAFDEMQEEFCESLLTSDALSDREAQTVLNELIRKNKRVSEDISTITQIQTRIIQREVKAARSAWDSTSLKGSEDVTSSNDRANEENALDVKRFLTAQLYLSEDDRDAIFKEHKVFNTLLNNERSFLTTARNFNGKVDLLRAQLEVFMAEREEERLSSDEDVEELVKKLDEGRMKFKANQSVSSDDHDRLTEIEQAHLCQLVAESIINNLLPEMRALKKQAEHLHLVKDKFVSGLKVEAGDDLVREFDRAHKERIAEVEASLLDQYNAEAQVLTDRLNYQHAIELQRLREQVDDRPLSASSLSNSDLLQRLHDQDRNKSKVESLMSEIEPTTKSHSHKLRLEFLERLQVSLQDLDKKFLCKLAKALGMKRNYLLESINEALCLASENERKKFTSDVMKHWEKVSFAPEPTTFPPLEEFSSNKPIAKPRKKTKSIFKKKTRRQML